jgi:hypothetical protein
VRNVIVTRYRAASPCLFAREGRIVAWQVSSGEVLGGGEREPLWEELRSISTNGFRLFQMREFPRSRLTWRGERRFTSLVHCGRN